MTELRCFTTGQEVDFLLNLSDFIVQFKKHLFRCFMLVEEILAFVEIFLTLLDVELQFVLHRRIARLQQHGVGELNRITHLFGLLCNMTFLRKRGKTLELFFLKQPDSVKVVFHHLLLLVGFSNLIIVRRHARHVVKHLPTLIGRHFSKARYVALEDDVVAVRPGVGSP